MKSTPRILPMGNDELRIAARLIAEGGVVAFPTDTVYGLGCDLYCVDAVSAIYEMKGRPSSMPLIAMIASVEQIIQVASFVPESAKALIERFWPGPLTVILPAREDIPVDVLGGGKTIGVRIPDHPLALEFLRECARPLATTSANVSGNLAACTAREAAEQLSGPLLILDGGAAPGGVPSTIVDCSVAPPVLLREGPICSQLLELLRGA